MPTAARAEPGSWDGRGDGKVGGGLRGEFGVTTDRDPPADAPDKIQQVLRAGHLTTRVGVTSDELP